MKLDSLSFKKVDVSTFDPNGAGETNGGIFGLNLDPKECHLHLIPVPWEPTTSYLKGTAKGPKAVLEASPQLDLFDAEFGQAFGLWRPWEYGIFCEPESREVKQWNREACIHSQKVIDAGGQLTTKALKQACKKTNEYSQKLNDWVYTQTKKKIAANKFVGILGGDHSVPYGAIQAIAHHHVEIGILHIDAHADLRFEYEGFSDSHASIMNKVLRTIPQVKKLVQVGIRDFCDMEYEQTQQNERLKTYFQFMLNDSEAHGTTWDAQCAEICAHLPQKVYVSFDIDGLDPALCPHTGTPVPDGLSYRQVCSLLKNLIKSGRQIVGFDLVEVAPHPQFKNDQWDGNVGARILYKLCASLFASQGLKT